MYLMIVEINSYAILYSKKDDSQCFWEVQQPGGQSLGGQPWWGGGMVDHPGSAVGASGHPPGYWQSTGCTAQWPRPDLIKW